ncbi:MAG: hypothetical protein HY006_03025 [Candidatus Sungbacteria bacterium]|nr:hypothetical protein [Candidatus Sungbacteria bacterium]
MLALGEKILWQRAKDYLSRYQPNLIGIAGGYNKTLTQAAIRLALGDTQSIRSIDISDNSKASSASAILGIHPRPKKLGFTLSLVEGVRLLVGSKVGELHRYEPTTILLKLITHKPGDMDSLAGHLPFTHAVMLNVGTSNMELFGRQSDLAHEMMSLPLALPPTGIAILNIDDPWTAAMAPRITRPKITYGKDPNADIRLIRADRLGLSGFSGEAAVAGRRYEFAFPHLVSRHHIEALLAALAVVHALKGDIAHAVSRLRHIQVPRGHMNIVRGKHASTIIDATADATPETISWGLKTLATLPASAPHSGHGEFRRIAILGDIANMGPHSLAAHQSIGQQVTAHCHVFVAVGQAMKSVQAAALQKGGVDTHHFQDARDVGKWLAGYIQPQDMIFIAGGKEMNMQTVVEALEQ